MSTIAANLQAVRRRISEALQGDRREVRLVAVSKSHPPESIREAHAAGCRDFGENYVQQAIAKIAALGQMEATWHFIGTVQTNKARDIAAHFDWVHGVASVRAANALARARSDAQPPLDVCLQVNISGESSKGGVQPADVVAVAREVAAIPRLRLRGLMGMAASTDDVAQQRRQFAVLREARDAAAAQGIAMDTLSMGMSQDLEAAIAEGSTLVRIGTAIFGERHP